MATALSTQSLAEQVRRKRSQRWCRWFPLYVNHYLLKHFQSIQSLNGLPLQQLDNRQLVIYTNHPSWWDPMLYMWLAQQYLPERQHFGPMDKVGLDQYPFMRKLGIFPVEQGSSRGGIQFLRTASGLLQTQKPTAVWVAATGQFQDATLRPMTVQSGIARLAARLASQSEQEYLFVPLALNYTFLHDRKPHAFVHSGQVVLAEDDPDFMHNQLQLALTEASDKLNHAICQRQPLTVLSDSTAGTGGIYQLSRQIKAFVQRKPYVAQHQLSTAPSNPTKNTKSCSS